MRDEAIGLRVQFEQQAKIAAAYQRFGKAALTIAGVTERDPPVQARDEIAIHEGQPGTTELVQAVGEI